MKCYLFDLKTVTLSDFKRFKRGLSAAEVLRLQKLSTPGRQREFIIGRALLKTAAARALKINSAHIEIITNPNGTLGIKGYADCGLSLSHSGDYVACVIAKFPVGIDIEQYQDKDFSRLMKRWFPKQCSSDFAALKKEKQADLFYTAWTRYEAAYKIAGAVPAASADIGYATAKTGDCQLSVAALGKRPKIEIEFLEV